MLTDALRAFAHVFSKPFRRVFWLSLLSTVVVLALFGAGGQWALDALPQFGVTWADTVLEWIARSFAIVVLIPLVHPVVSLVAGLFLERIAAIVEAEDYPTHRTGRDQPFLQSLLVSVRFTLVLIAVNIVALPFYLLPGVNLVLFWIINGYLLGREYFELVALRHVELEDARALRRRHKLRIFVGGVAVAGFATVPFLNLLTPLFATAFMVHISKRIGLT